MKYNPYPLLESALLSSDPAEKCALVRELAAEAASADSFCREGAAIVDFRYAGHPEKPTLVPHWKVIQRKMGSAQGYAAMLHAICHIEFNAIC